MRVFYGLKIKTDIAGHLHKLAQKTYNKLPKQTHWTTEDNYHITVKFLGNVEQSDIEKINQSIEENIKGIKPFPIHITSITPFPALHSKIIAACAELHTELDALYNAVDAAVADDGLDIETQCFSPHITLCRRYDHDHHILAPIIIEDLTLTVDDLILYEVRQKPGGSEYHPVKHFTLG
ncbi:MAG: RNA 2',3'-cyclic phosphodiesterase [Gammaproteobacteria bacterium]|nr:RNA 2',3'-cyclic phosphodiesterase [Gammaproteobacteria bacterium]